MQPPLAIDGIVPVIPTPFAADEEIDWSALGSLIDFAVAAGACAVCLPAYGSEFYKLSEAERLGLVEQAVRCAAGRLPVLAQVNYASARQAARVAARCEQCGAAGISVAVPRLFPLAESDLARYFARILQAIRIPLLIQDFNPGGPTVSPGFVKALHEEFPHFCYVKLEEPLMAAKVERILEETGGAVGVLEGWGGMYTLELVEAGICGVMPGLALTDLLARVFRLARGGDKAAAWEIFQGVLPQIVYSLQNLELYHHAEKSLLAVRGVLPAAHVREARLELRAPESAHLEFLNGRILALLERLGMPANPARREA
jgi:dihydrodipicolinate synthase/N-acetylneuraminate lyase